MSNYAKGEKIFNCVFRMHKIVAVKLTLTRQRSLVKDLLYIYIYINGMSIPQLLFLLFIFYYSFTVIHFLTIQRTKSSHSWRNTQMHSLKITAHVIVTSVRWTLHITSVCTHSPLALRALTSDCWKAACGPHIRLKGIRLQPLNKQRSGYVTRDLTKIYDSAF